MAARKVKRLAVLGLYNSGSTAVAAMLHHLGVNMAPPYWVALDRKSNENYYEPYELSWHLRQWWEEPRITERTPAQVRVRYLRQWAVLQESLGLSPIVGAKHPLLSLCGEDLLEAWGQDTLFIWSWRPLTDSVSALQRRGWFGEHARQIQERLWEALQQFDKVHPGLVFKLDWDHVKSDPLWAAHELASLCGIVADDDRLKVVASQIRPSASSREMNPKPLAFLKKAKSRK
jgi:hypothetical protein